ncbi:MAG: ubiquinol--cytochrome-c reductase subunit 6 [Watsoniomyces obsoletus]|nr:MAG: ubiquinol--cytochrome-c reductase subunit 6 [Watsoniomyces obsoletus]
MSVNWVMLSDTEGFVRLPGERILYSSPPRTTLALQSSNSPSGAPPVSLSSSSGHAFLTNQRIVYLPASPVPALKSFSAPILNLHDTHVSAPFFGPNTWRASVQPVPGGGLSSAQSVIELKMIFKDGGAFDFHSNFERIKERIRQAVDVARESGQIVGDGSATGRGGVGLSGINLAAIDLEQLPAYEEARNAPAPSLVPPLVSLATDEPPQSGQHASVGSEDASEGLGSPTEASPPENSAPSEPPPGYEEVQRASVAMALENRIG